MIPAKLPREPNLSCADTGPDSDGHDAGTNPPPASPSRLKRWGMRCRTAICHPVGRVATVIIVAGLSLVGWRIADVQVGRNFAAIEPAVAYRSAQLTPNALRTTISENHLKAVINLRGANPDKAWYRDELAVCADTGVQHYDIRMTATALPTPEIAATLLETLRTAPRPFLVHCRSGADRTGLAAAIFHVTEQGDNLDDAVRTGLMIWHGHLAFGPNSAMDRFFALYTETADGLPLERWIGERYPAIYRQSLGEGAPASDSTTPIGDPDDISRH